MPEAWASMRSTARCVLPVLVGPSTATRCDGAAPVDLSLMSRNPTARTARLESRQGLPRIVYAPTAYASGFRDKHRGRRCQRSRLIRAPGCAILYSEYAEARQREEDSSRQNQHVSFPRGHDQMPE